MSVYTKKGDKGKTHLFGGIKLSKSDTRIKTLGSIDELNSYIGLIRSYQVIPKPIVNFLLQIQNDLFKISAMLACTKGQLSDRLPNITEDDIEKIEIQIDKYEKLLPEQKYFILPGGTIETSFIHIARSVCRRAETYTVELSERGKIESLIIKYLNRLSDYFFILARYIAHLQELKETRADLHN